MLTIRRQYSSAHRHFNKLSKPSAHAPLTGSIKGAHIKALTPPYAHAPLTTAAFKGPMVILHYPSVYALHGNSGILEAYINAPSSPASTGLKILINHCIKQLVKLIT